MARMVRIPTTNWIARNLLTPQVSAGSGATLINVLLDTGSSMVAVDGARYDALADPHASTTRLPQTERFQTQPLWAVVVRTTVGLAANDTVLVNGRPNTSLAVIYDTSPGQFSWVDGVLGLAYPALNTAHHATRSTRRLAEPCSSPATNRPAWSDQGRRALPPTAES